MAAYGVAADLIVARRGSDEDMRARSTLEAVLLETGRPVLIPAAAAMPAKFERIAIAWKPTPQAARAVAFAMPFLPAPRRSSSSRWMKPGGRATTADRLVRNLVWHGFAATRRAAGAGA